MKLSRIILACTLLIFQAGLMFSQNSNLTFQPEKPKPGDVVKITYTPSAEFAAEQGSLRCDAYKYGFYNEQLAHGAKPLKCQLVKLLKSGNTYIGEVKTDPDTRLLAFTFTFGDRTFKILSGQPAQPSGKTDNNQDKGYFTLIYDANGKVLSPSPLLAAVYQCRNDDQLFAKYLDQQIEIDSTYRNLCYEYKISKLIRKDDPTEAKKMVQTELERLFAKGLTTEEDYYTTLLFHYVGYGNVANYFEKIGNEKFDSTIGVYRAIMLQKTVWYEKDIDKQAVEVKNVEDFYARADWRLRLSAFAGSNSAIDVFYHLYLSSLANAGRVKEIIDAVKRKNYFNYYYGSYVGWNRIIRALLEKKDPATPELIAAQEQHVKTRLESLKKDPEQPSATPEEDCLTTTARYREVVARYVNLQYQSAQYYFNIADLDKGYPYIKTAYNISKELNFQCYDSYPVNDLYLKYTDKFAPKESKALIESYVLNNCCPPDAKDALKKIYVAEKGSEVGFDDYFSALNKANAPKVDVKEAIKARLIKMPAPKFALQDLDGKTVSLESLKGKTVILDFWATWCGPCIASFPAMLKLKEKYASNGDVVILFINTWERDFKSSQELRQRIADFLKSKNFDINPLLDEKSTVVFDYNIQGIPTKIVIDKNGNIRYKIASAETDKNKLIEEMDAMIESVK